MPSLYFSFPFDRIKKECVSELMRFAVIKKQLIEYEGNLSLKDKEELFFTRDKELFDTFKKIRKTETHKLCDFPIKELFMYFDRLSYFITSVEPVPGKSEGFLVVNKRLLLNDPVLYALYFVENAQRNS